MLKHMRIRMKIYALAGLLLALLVGTNLFTLTKVSTIAGEIEEVAKEDIPLTEALTVVSKTRVRAKSTSPCSS